jgi:hypothetical protein
MRSHSEVIEAFGGLAALATAINVNAKRAVHWPVRGIPSKYWLCVEDAATARGLRVTARDLKRLSPLKVAAE